MHVIKCVCVCISLHVSVHLLCVHVYVLMCIRDLRYCTFIPYDTSILETKLLCLDYLAMYSQKIFGGCIISLSLHLKNANTLIFTAQLMFCSWNVLYSAVYVSLQT